MITAMEVVSALVVGDSERSAENPTHRTGEGAHWASPRSVETSPLR
jgi:hypothetical protein